MKDQQIIEAMSRAMAEADLLIYSGGELTGEGRKYFESLARAALKALRKWERQQIKSGRAIRIAVKCREGR